MSNWKEIAKEFGWSHSLFDGHDALTIDNIVHGVQRMSEEISRLRAQLKIAEGCLLSVSAPIKSRRDLSKDQLVDIVYADIQCAQQALTQIRDTGERG